MTAPAPKPAILGRGSSVGRYFILGELGQGGMGVVYAAYDPELDRRVAIKVLLVGDGGSLSDGRTRLLREAQALAQLSHPAVVAIHDVGTLGEQVWIAMEFVDGRTLAESLATRRPAWPEVLSLFRRAGEGLAAAHAKGIVHRDFKPETRCPAQTAPPSAVRPNSRK
ncbi:MAG: serine/threonine protein kinase [Myxococcales bacterium]|nr:serine/threonine protein kinase [Myxococcales bacterium]